MRVVSVRPRMDHMTTTDEVRAGAVVAAAVLQVAGGAVGGSGAWGEPVGTVANDYPTPLLPGGGAFTIWSLIYLTFAALAVRQAGRAQRTRDVHRRTGWWLAAAGVLNAGWVALFAHRYLVLAQAVIVLLLAVLLVVAVRLARMPAAGWADRLLLYLPVTLYAGWVAIATVAGAATTWTALDSGLSATGALVAVLATGGAVAAGALYLPAVTGFTASACWALLWIAAGTPEPAVRAGAIVAVAAVLIAAGVRVLRSADPARTAWG
jgi:tryptophan-rich sensory protein